MKTSQLLNKEEIITMAAGGDLTLTTQRIRLVQKTSKSTDIHSMCLDKISSVEINHEKDRKYLILGILALAGGVYFLSESESMGTLTLFAIGIILIAVYYRMLKHLVVITSDGGSKLIFHTDGLPTSDLIKFLDQLEEAKLDLLLAPSPLPSTVDANQVTLTPN